MTGECRVEATNSSISGEGIARILPVPAVPDNVPTA
jgi:hypothetical protein